MGTIIWQDEKYRVVKLGRMVPMNETKGVVAFYTHYTFEQLFNDAMGERSWRPFASFDQGKKPTKVTLPVRVLMAILEKLDVEQHEIAESKAAEVILGKAMLEPMDEVPLPDPRTEN